MAPKGFLLPLHGRTFKCGQKLLVTSTQQTNDFENAMLSSYANKLDMEFLI